MKYPNKTSYGWISIIKSWHFLILLLVLLSLYGCINCIFAIIYYLSGILKCGASLLDYFYFSFVTALTIGYGDFYPIVAHGKILVIVHTCFTAVYFAIMVAALSAKMFYPKNTIYFSNKILFNPDQGIFTIRLMNTHKERLVNPEIRIFMTEHCCGNVIGPMHKISKIDDIPYLGKHDLSISFHNQFNSNPQRTVSDELQKAINHDNDKNNTVKSRFRITISVTGSYGLQQFIYYKKYYPSDIEIGYRFKPIEYNEEDQRNGNIRYTKFPNFWNDFNTIEVS